MQTIFMRFPSQPTNRSANRGALRSACSSISATTSSIDQSRVSIPAAIDEFLYSIKKEGTPASLRLKTARSTISR